MDKTVYGPNNFFEPSDCLTSELAENWNKGIQETYKIAGYGGSLKNWKKAKTKERKRVIRWVKTRVKETTYGLLVSLGEDFNNTEAYGFSNLLARCMRGGLGFGTKKQWESVVQELCEWVESQGGQVETGWGFTSYKDGELKAWRTK